VNGGGDPQPDSAAVIPQSYDPDGFRILFRIEYPRLVAHLVSRGVQRADAEESAEYALTTLYTERPGIETDVHAWLIIVAWRHHCRRTRRRQSLTDGAGAGETSGENRQAAPDRDGRQQRRTPRPAEGRNAAEEWVELHDEERAVIVALQQLPRRQRDCMALFFDGYKAREIADLLDMRAATVRSNIRHAKETLRRVLFGGEADEGREGHDA
jgi:RNA polymerase sigma-70 factor (ECF subfamily)